jgi:mono/diheme cytochrome c family protein
MKMRARRYPRPALAACLVLAGAALAPHAAAAGPEGYAEHCQACHDRNGEGTPRLAPPLAGVLARRAALPEGRDYIARVLLYGMSGPIVSRGQRYSRNMPRFAELVDEVLAAIVNHVLSAFNGGGASVDAATFAAARGTPMSAAEVRRLREQVLEVAGE